METKNANLKRKREERLGLEEEFHKQKKIKKETMCIISIIDKHEDTKEWLVEWTDRSRTWEKYDTIKDLPVFQTFLDNILNQVSIRNTPVYIS